MSSYCTHCDCDSHNDNECWSTRCLNPSARPLHFNLRLTPGALAILLAYGLSRD